MITVYHLQLDNPVQQLVELYREIRLDASESAVLQVLSGELFGISYKPVANVSTEFLEDAYQLTNSINDYWGRNENVTEVSENNRSTYVGDLMMKEGELFIVASMGFKKLEL